MILGIGIDTVDITKMDTYIKKLGHNFLRRTFTDKENISAENHSNSSEYYATRFAVKEAVFKALAHLTKSKTFDMRIVETLNREDGSPYVNQSQQLLSLMQEIQATKIHVSITTENNYATAFVIIE